MRIVCDSCGAVYKIADEKLVKEVNKATCKRCGHKIIIRKPRAAASVEGPSERTIISPGGPAAERPKKKKDEKTVITTIPELEKYESAAVSAGAIGSLTSELRTITAPADIPSPSATDSLGPQESSYTGFDDAPAVNEPAPMPQMPSPPPPPPAPDSQPVATMESAPVETATPATVSGSEPSVDAPPPPPPAPPTSSPDLAAAPPPPEQPDGISIAAAPSTGPLFDEAAAAPPPPPSQPPVDTFEQADLSASINQPTAAPATPEPAAMPAAGEVRTATRDLEAAPYQPKGEFLGIIFFALVAMLGLVITTVSGALPLPWFVSPMGYGLVWTAVLASFLVAILSGLGRKKGHAFIMLILGGFLGFLVAFGLNYGVRLLTPNIGTVPTNWTNVDIPEPPTGDASGDTGDWVADDATGDPVDDTAMPDENPDDPGEDPTGDPAADDATDPAADDAVADDVAPPPEDPTPPPVENPAIIFASSPSGAAIYMEGIRLGKAAYRYEQGTPGRRYSVTFKKDGYEDATASGTFPSTGTITVRGTLARSESDAVATTTTDDPPDPPTPASDLPDASEVLTPSIIEAIVGSNASIKRCFAEAQARGDVVAGKLWVKFTVNPDGNVSKAHIVTADYAGTDLDSCVSGQINRLQFAPFAGSTSKTVKYPFVVSGR